MDCNIPPSNVIPAVAARLKYYVEVQRKEVGFDLSVNQNETVENYKLYQLSKGHAPHQIQRIKKIFLDNQMETSIRICSAKVVGEQNKKIHIDPEKKQHVQRKIKDKMSSISNKDLNTANNIYPRRVYVKPRTSDLEEISSHLYETSPPDMSQEEITRLISSAAKLIVATTSGKPHQWVPTFHKEKLPSSKWNNSQSLLPYHQKNRIGSSSKTKVDGPRYSLCLKIPSQESCSGPDWPSHGESVKTHSKEDMDLSVNKNQTEIDSKETHKDDVEYKITIHTGTRSTSEAKQVLLITLVGEKGRTEKQYLENSSANSIPFRSGQVDIFNLKTKNVGKLKYVIIRMKDRDANCRFYCRDIIVKKEKTEDENYIFHCNKWLSSFQTVVPIHAHTKTSASTPVPPIDDLQEKTWTKNEKYKAKIKKFKDGKVSSKLLSKKAEKSTCGRREVVKESNSGGLGTAFFSTPKSKSRVSPTSVGTKYYMSVFGNSQEVLNSSDNKNYLKTTSDEELESNKKCSTLLPSPMDSQANTMMENTNEGSLGENNILEDEKNFGPDVDLQIQNTIPGDVVKEHRKASSPVSYVFFSHELKGDSPLIIEPYRHSPTENISNIDNQSKRERKMSTPALAVETQSTTCDEENYNDRTSKHPLLQETLQDLITKSSASSVAAESDPMDGNLENIEKAGRHVTQDNSTGHNEFQIVPVAQMPQSLENYSLGDGDESIYVSDTTLEEDYLFSDRSSALHFSEDEESNTDSSGSKSENTFRKDMRRKVTKPAVISKRSESVGDSTRIFQIALAAITNNDTTELKNLCRRNFFLLSSTDKEGKTLLHHAASQGSDNICQVLLATNVGMINIDRQDIFGKTALHYAMENGNNKTIKLLLNNGAKPEFPDENSKTFWMLH
ncbi:uncharacterized protein LOC134571302 [Pelobates fuscus]|uniref:uncharacterized protein LOC134571302 n=1 Tax=Pelobates fuscus TaxID=191477 RepID=UPI002FE4BB8A